MAQFKYVALDSDGQKKAGVVSAINEQDAAGRIKETCEVILKLSEIEEKDKSGFLNMEIGGNRLNSKAFTVACNQFAIILQSGIPVAHAVNLVAEKTADKTLKSMFEKVAVDVESGRSMSASFEDHGKKILPVTFIETLRAGEESGNLDRSFATMAEHYDKQTKMRAKVRSAMAYPSFIMVLAVVVVTVLVTFVIPRMMPIFTESGGELPLPTRMLLAISDFFSKYILVIVLVVALLVLLIKLYGNTEKGRMQYAKILLRIPVIGNIQELTAASQFSNTMAAMLRSGLPVTKAVNITGKVVDNFLISTQTTRLTELLESGHSLGTSMRDGTIYPDILIDMTSVGEQTGELEQTLTTIANYYDAELDEATQSALAKLEPAMLIFIAVVAGFIVLAMYMAMFAMYDNM